MPLYDYICTACDYKDELLLIYKEAKTKRICPGCKKKQFLKQISKPGLFKLVGEGFYKRTKREE